MARYPHAHPDYCAEIGPGPKGEELICSRPPDHTGHDHAAMRGGELVKWPATTEKVVFGQVYAFTGLELANRLGRAETLDRITHRLDQQLVDAVDERGGDLSLTRIQYEIRATYTATVPKRAEVEG